MRDEGNRPHTQVLLHLPSVIKKCSKVEDSIHDTNKVTKIPTSTVVIRWCMHIITNAKLHMEDQI